MSNDVENLASYQRCVQSIRANWPAFQEKRKERLEQQGRYDRGAAEKVAENILEDLFTEVLDWTVADLNNQVEHADLLLTRLGIKYLLIEVKRPGSLAWNRRAVESALDQAMRYAGEQKVKCVAVSDGVMLYTADIEHGGLRDRAFVSLQSEEPQEKMLWRISLHGIYRPCESSEGAALDLIPEARAGTDLAASAPEEQLLHPKYKVPARCFAYVGDPSNTATWKLPYRLADGSPDVKRLPKAIQAILSNYRGVKVSSVPEKDIPDVLVRLARAAASQGRMPQQSGDTAPVYRQLAEALEQLGRLEEVIEKGY
jgi:hypothetical protein